MKLEYKALNEVHTLKKLIRNMCNIIVFESITVLYETNSAPIWHPQSTRAF